MRDFLALLILGILPATVPAGEKPKRLTTQDCENLIEQLANPNKEPFKKNWVFPEDVRAGELLKSFEKIREAYNTLSKNCDVALPVLRKHLEDERYSFVQEQPGSGVYAKISVGHACSDIIDAHVQAHHRYTWCDDGEGRPRTYFFDWRRAGKDKSLAELQHEAMEWVMKKEKPKFFKSEKAWKESLKNVGAMADSVRKSKKAVAVDHRFHSIE